MIGDEKGRSGTESVELITQRSSVRVRPPQLHLPSSEAGFTPRVQRGAATRTRVGLASIPNMNSIGYIEAVHKTTIEFDPAKRDAVAAVLGTTGLKATVDAAFDAVLRQHAGRELVRLVQEGEVELANDEVESQAWRD